MSAWFAEALKHLQDYVDNVGGDFMTSDVRSYAEDRGLVINCDKRAWGAVMKTAAKKGVIESTGYRKSTNPNAHGSPMASWVGIYA